MRFNDDLDFEDGIFGTNELVEDNEIFDFDENGRRKYIGLKKEIKEMLYKKQKKKCKECGEKFKLSEMHLDHIVPVNKGGNNEITNFQLLCEHCNCSKGDTI